MSAASSRFQRMPISPPQADHNWLESAAVAGGADTVEALHAENEALDIANATAMEMQIFLALLLISPPA